MTCLRQRLCRLAVLAGSLAFLLSGEVVHAPYGGVVDVARIAGRLAEVLANQVDLEMPLQAVLVLEACVTEDAAEGRLLAALELLVPLQRYQTAIAPIACVAWVEAQRRLAR